ncbi:MAG: prolipoprotein diacylglyceryl transferase [Ruminiclostridium sp.]|nr:prolipoprotein diacylglyceryl transferase [Ruminiclostridium sp.]
MSTVTFPGLGLTFHLNRVAISIGSFDIYWYGIIIGLGFVLGGAFCCLQAPKFGLRADDILDTLLFAGPIGIVGARIYYIVFNPSLYLNADGGLNLKACLNVHNGGLAIYGGIIFGVLTAWVVARYKKIPFPVLIDGFAFGLLIGQMAGRWGNFFNVEAYGRETTLPWRMGIEDVVGGVTRYMEVHPTFLYESLWNLLGLCLLLFVLYKGLRKFDGMLFLLYVAWYGFGRGIIESLRTDSLYFFGTGIRTSQMVGFVSCAIAVVIILWKLRQKPDRRDLYVNKKKV